MEASPLCVAQVALRPAWPRRLLRYPDHLPRRYPDGRHFRSLDQHQQQHPDPRLRLGRFHFRLRKLPRGAVGAPALDAALELVVELVTVAEAEMGLAREPVAVRDPGVAPVLVVELGRVGEPEMAEEPEQVAVVGPVVAAAMVARALEELA
jgi:hypothetical protein